MGGAHRAVRRGGAGHLRPAGLPGSGHRSEFPAPAFPLLDGGLRRARRALAVPHLVARRPRRRAHRREHAARRRPHEAGRLRHPARRHSAVAGGRAGVGAAAHGPGDRQRALRRILRHGPARPEVRHRLLQRQPHGLRPPGPRHAQRHGPERRRAPDVLARYHDRPLLRYGGRHLRPRPHPRHPATWRPREAHADRLLLLRGGGLGLARFARPERFRRRAARIHRRLPGLLPRRRPGGRWGDGDGGLHTPTAGRRLLRPPRRGLGTTHRGEPRGADRRRCPRRRSDSLRRGALPAAARDHDHGGAAGEDAGRMSAVQLLLPELLLGVGAFAVLGFDLVLPRERRFWLFPLGVVGVVAVGISLLTQVGQRGMLGNRLFVLDGYTLFFHTLLLIIAAVVLLFSADYVRRFLSYPGEFVALILLSTLGMMFIAAAGELLTAYISLELLSFCLYILASYAREDAKSNEAGLKYVLLGALATALLLLGVSLVYGYAGSTFYREIAVALSGRDLPPGVWMGLALLLAGLGFKVAAVPFHARAPHVYEI